MCLPPQFEPPSPFNWTGFLTPLPFSILALLEFTISKLPKWYLAWCYSTGFSPLVDSHFTLEKPALQHASALSALPLLCWHLISLPPLPRPGAAVLLLFLQRAMLFPLCLYWHTAFFCCCFPMQFFLNFTHKKRVKEISFVQDSKRDTDVKNSLLDSVGEGEGGMIWENSNETCILSQVK